MLGEIDINFKRQSFSANPYQFSTSSAGGQQRLNGKGTQVVPSLKLHKLIFPTVSFLLDFISADDAKIALSSSVA